MGHPARSFVVGFVGGGLCVVLAAVSMLLAGTQLAIRPVSAQTISPDLISPDVVNQILGDFLRQQSTQTGVPIQQTSPVDQTRDAAAQARQAAQEQQLRALQEQANKQASEQAAQEAARKDLSALELDYSDRIGEAIALFGYDIFSQVPSLPELIVGTAPLNYRLGVGDEVIVSFVGSKSNFQSSRVDREGRLLLPELGPVPAAGRLFTEVQAEIEQMVANRFIDTQAFVSLGGVRSLQVMVLGEVNRPGVQIVTGLSTLLDALFSAGGVKRTGSLRQIQIVRSDEVVWYDLYDLLVGRGVDKDMTMRDGDRIVVPPIGATVAVAGKVKRPAIYELPEGRIETTAEEILAYAGGPLRPSGNRYVRLSMDATGRQQVTEVGQDASTGTRVANGDVLTIAFSDDVQVGSVFLEGAVRVPGRRSLVSAPTVRSLVRDVQSLSDAPYLLFAVLQTHDPYTHSARLVPVDLQRVLSGVQDIPLSAEDRLIVLDLSDIRYLWSSDVQGLLSGEMLADQLAEIAASRETLDTQSAEFTSTTGAEQGTTGFDPATTATGLVGQSAAGQQVAALAPTTTFDAALAPCKGLLLLGSVVTTSNPGRFNDAILTAIRDLKPVSTARMECPEIYDTYPDLLPFVLENMLSLSGEVRVPGAYPVAPNSPLSNVVAYAGGVSREADLSKVEILRTVADPASGESKADRQILNVAQGGMEAVFVSPGDSVRVNARFNDRDEKPVLLAGEFVRPGLYLIRRGERLSDVIARAGGLTPQAYPYGAVFTRDRTKQAEKIAFERAARELEIALAAALTSRSSSSQAATGADALRGLAQQLRNAEPVGRVVIEADPTVLQVRPELDTVMEGGDRLFMPKRPNSVTVIGDVLNEGTLQFVPGSRVDDYIDKAGGLRRTADDGRVFVILPNGEAQPVSVSAWNYSPVTIPPGSTVVVPKEPAPFDAFSFIKDITQITSQLAITAAALSAISD